MSFSIALTWQGSNTINPIGRVPTYIHIDSFTFQNNSSLNLPTTHAISNVWVYYNDNPVGEFDLPCTIPIIATGSQQVQLFPGIIVNGLNSLTGIYPFYTADTFTLAAQPGNHVQYRCRLRPGCAVDI